jgi:hypothetical protein
METKIYAGKLRLDDYGEAYDILFISSHEKPLADILANDISGKNVSARYWVCDKEMTKDQAQKSFLTSLMGMAHVDFGPYYSEVTGYLWTDEEIKIGGHDLLAELKSYAGKWLILEIDIHE